MKKRILRISLGVLTIFFVLIIAINYLDRVLTKEAQDDLSLLGEYPRPAAAAAVQGVIGYKTARYLKGQIAPADIAKVNTLYKAAGYVAGSRTFPALGYDQATRRLKPFDLLFPKGITEKPLQGTQIMTVFASYRDVIASSNNDLESRVRKLENTVNRIINQCCLQAK